MWGIASVSLIRRIIRSPSATAGGVPRCWVASVRRREKNGEGDLSARRSDAAKRINSDRIGLSRSDKSTRTLQPSIVIL
jgi:hypothetical protein